MVDGAPAGAPAPAVPPAHAGAPVEADAADGDLLAAYLQGDQAAFAVLYERYRRPLYAFFARQLPHAQADDAFQETWMKFIRNIQRYEDRGKLQSYLFAIANNVLMDDYRRQMRSGTGADNEESSDVEDTGSNVQQDVSRQQLHAALQAQIAKLPVGQRSVWVLRQETGLSLAELAEITGSPLEAVKSRLRYAADKLKAGMQRYAR